MICQLSREGRASQEGRRLGPGKNGCAKNSNNSINLQETLNLDGNKTCVCEFQPGVLISHSIVNDL